MMDTPSKNNNNNKLQKAGARGYKRVQLGDTFETNNI